VKVSALLVLAFASVATAFTPGTPIRSSRAISRATSQPKTIVSAENTFWEGSAPPSSVLGPLLSKQGSGTLGMASLLFFAIGTYSCVTNDAQLPVVDPKLVLGGMAFTPISWGLHVAAWVQKSNGK